MTGDGGGTSPMAQWVKNLPAMQETWVQSLGQEDPQRRDWLPTPVFLPGESHRLRTLLGSSAYGQKVLDTTEMTEHACLYYLLSSVVDICW